MLYKAASLLGEGAFGKVYKAKCSDNDTVVAVKVVRTSKQVERRMALQEVRINQMISHIAIVRFEQAWTDLGCVYSVFELCSTNLSAYIDNLQATRAKDRLMLSEQINLERISIQLILALHYLHSDSTRPKSIVHRDLKPENVLLDATGNAKISDFGLACLLDKGQKARLGIAGTPGFRSPEMLKGNHYGTATDIWSLGNLLWELFTGLPLHREMGARTSRYNQEINMRHGRQDFSLRLAVETMLSQRDDARPSAGDLLSDAKIAEVLFNLWRPESTTRLGVGNLPGTVEARPSPADNSHDGNTTPRQQFETAVATSATEQRVPSKDLSIPEFRFRRIKLGR